MSRVINDSGDTFKPTQQGRGVDISSQRTDELDDESLAFIEARANLQTSTVAIDLGGGFGIHSIRMAQAGAQVFFIDVNCAQAQVNFDKAAEDQEINVGSITPLYRDFRHIQEGDIPKKYSVLYSQRALHYIKYKEAEKLLNLFFNQMAHGGKAFLSVAGFDTEYGKTFPDREKPVQDRFALVTEDMQAKHGIEHPIVTYTEDEFRMLLKGIGFDVESVKASSFGNIKAIACKPKLCEP